jgi:Ser/Thr protein kinase RdoA (MazF antagonist)
MDHKLILGHYFSQDVQFGIELFGNGLIHKTYLLSKNNLPYYILQQVNTAVFKQPDAIANNLERLEFFLREKDIPLFFPLPLKTLSGEYHLSMNEMVLRLTAFVKNSHSIDSCNNPDQAYAAAFQFGKFTAAFDGLNTKQLQPTIPDFHNLTYRWKQFEEALHQGNKDRIQFAEQQIKFIFENKSIVDRYETILKSPSFFQRVTHHDTKINNVLFDKKGEGLCVIDLDTVMSGLSISDLGDMFRTYLSPGTEEELDLEKVFVRKAYFTAIVEGYLEKMAGQLSVEEKDAIPFAGEFLIYMQALRFLTDFINNDVYYEISYELNNYNRTVNQLHLLNSYRKTID